MAIRLLSVILCFLWSVSCFAHGQNRKLVVLFTSDLHSQVLPHCNNTGGFARIASIFSMEKEKADREGAAFLMLDGGDISMGSVFHTLYGQQAIEYRAMARMGYDAFTVGNHAYDFGVAALSNMFSNARAMDPDLDFPVPLCANLQCDGISFQKYVVFERNGIKIGVFGIMGENSFNVIGKAKGDVKFTNPVKVAEEMVEILEPQTDYIIAVSHGGRLNGDDTRLARKVGGIDFIISAHDHETLHSPKYVGRTPIGAAACRGKYVGKAVFQNGKLEEYSLIETVSSIPLKPEIEFWVDSMYNVVAAEFVRVSGRRLDDTIAHLDKVYPLELDEDGKMVLGTNIAAAYREAAIERMPDLSPDKIIGMTPYGVIRGGLDEVTVTNRAVFEVLSLGENERGATGYPLVYAWVTGEELEDLCEMSVSIAPLLEDTRLFFSGLQYRYNGAGLPFFRVDRVKVGDSVAGKDELYMIVTGLYTAKLTGLLDSSSYGILSLVPKDSYGNPLADGFLELCGKDGKTITEWEAFAQYVQGGRFDGNADAESVENDDFVPLGYTLGAILICAAVLYFMRKRV